MNEKASSNPEIWPAEGPGNADAGRFLADPSSLGSICAAVIDGDFRFVEVNAALERYLGYPAEEMIGRTEEELALHSDPNDAAEVRRQVAQLGFVRDREVTLRTRDRALVTALLTIERPGLLGAGRRLCLLADTTRTRDAQKALIDLRHALTMSREAKRAFTRIRDPEEVARELCRIAIDAGGFGRAWIGLVEAETGGLCAAASACIHTDPLRAPHQHEGTHDACAVDQALASGRSVVEALAAPGPGTPACHQAAWRAGFRTVAAFPIITSGRTRGVLTLYSKNADFFTSGEVELLEELADDMSFSIDLADRERERSRALASARESEGRYGELVLGSPHAILIMRDGRLAFANPAAARLFGVDDFARLLGKTPFEIMHAEFHEVIRQNIETIRRGGTVPPTRERVVRPDGSVREVEATPTRLHDTDAMAIQVVLRDITDQLESVNALAQSEDRLRKAQAMAHVGNWRIDLAAGTIWGSEEASRIYGLDPRVSIRPLADVQSLVVPEDRDGLDAALRGLVAGTAPYEQAFRIRTASGELRSLHSRAERVLDGTGAPVAVVGVVQDITERTRAEMEREKLEVQLRQAQKMESIGRLAGGVAHDFNNLLAPILGYAELLLLDRRLGDAAVDELRQIHNAAERARDLTRQLLAFSRRQLLSVQTHDLRQIVSDFAPLLRRTVREEISVAVTLPEQPVTVRVDAGQVQQVLMNLAVNAQDAIDGAGAVTIEVTDVTIGDHDAGFHPELPRGAYAVLSVSDTGCGMDDATMGRLFEPFFTTKQEGKGTGLGLSTAFGIIKQHEGQITVYSEPGTGSTFRVYLPLSPHAAAGRGPEEEAGYPRGSEKILVVEDNEPVRELTVRMLGKLGYEVRAAAGFPEALAVMEAEGDTVSLVLTDVVMPHTNGRELFALLSRGQPLLKVLYMSGYADEVITRHGVLEEGISFIEKPFSMRAMARKLREVLGT